MKLRFRYGVLYFAMLAMSSQAAEVSESTTTVIDSEVSLIEILESTQFFFQQICPPMPQMYVDRKSIPYPVDWLGFSKKTTKYLTAEMDQYGLPRYRLLIYEDVVTRDRVITLAATGFEVARIAAPKDYQPELYYQSLLLKGAVYSEAMRWIFDPAHTATEVILYPETLYSSYVEYEEEQAVQESLLTPMAMASSGPPVPGGSTNTTGTITVTNNAQVTLALSLAENFGAYVEIYGRETLIWHEWDLMDGWVPTHGSESVEWMDAASSNKSTFFYQFFDATIDSDGDGYSDSREVRVTETNPNVFNLVNTDGDDLHDWWEIKLFGDLNQTGSGDFDLDGLLNNEELIGTVGGISMMYTDPSLFDTDGDGLGDGFELLGSPPTDPLSDDATPPVITISSPAPETVFVP